MEVSSAQLVYGNAIDIDSNILLPRDEIDHNPLTSTTSTSNMLKMQDEPIRITAQLLKESDDLNNAVNSFVFVAQRTTPATRMHTLLRGSLRVISNIFAEYT